MSDLIAVAYPDINRAEQVLDTLSQMRSAQLIDLEDACYVTEDAKGSINRHLLPASLADRSHLAPQTRIAL